MRTYLNIVGVMLTLILLLIICVITVYTQKGKRRQKLNKYRVEYTNTWVMHVKDGPDIALKLAHQHKFTYHGQLESLKDFYYLEHENVSIQSINAATEHHILLANHPKVLWLEQQTIKRRFRRGYFSDPLFTKQWYLKNAKDYICSDFKSHNSHDVNVIATWTSNITGRGVVVTILDDGVEHTHPDLKENFDFGASYDINENDFDPLPRYTYNDVNNHGTRCAGEVAALPNNGICGVGVAFNAKLGGIRMLDGKVTDIVEARSLSFKPEYIDIYSVSWGPSDNGRTVDGPGHLAKKALENGIRYGRGNLGSIYVWATGNGGRYGDHCSCDGYINSPYTISIGAVDICGTKPWYAEECPGTLAVTYGSKASGDYNTEISTTDLHAKCTTRHTGSSAAAPLAAGIFALVLEANPKLTWRDLQHLIVKTSQLVSPKDTDWITNKAGHKINPKFGFGALDVGRLVGMAKAKNWKTSASQRICKTYKSFVHMPLQPKGSIETTLKSAGCAHLKNCVTKLEHVQIVVTLIKKEDRGKLDITLTSPSGTKSPILKTRYRDRSGEGFTDWEFLTVFHWDENPSGKWRLLINDNSRSHGKLDSWYLKFYGTCDTPNKMHIKAPKLPKLKPTTWYTIVPLVLLFIVVLVIGSKYLPLLITCGCRVLRHYSRSSSDIDIDQVHL